MSSKEKICLHEREKHPPPALQSSPAEDEEEEGQTGQSQSPSQAKASSSSSSEEESESESDAESGERKGVFLHDIAMFWQLVVMTVVLIFPVIY